jgi:copper(I)-binding protein
MVRSLLAAFALFGAASLAHAQEIEVRDAYARSSSPAARTGAIFMELHNAAEIEDRLVAVEATVAERAELHTHISDDSGVMRMIEVEDGIAVPAGGSHRLARGGDHVMLIRLTEPLEQGASFPVTLTFEHAGEITVDVPVDSERMPERHGDHDMTN